MDANSWVLIIGALGLIVAQVTTAVLSYLRDRDKLQRDIQVAQKVEAVRLAAKDARKDLQAVAEKIEEVHKATNSLTDRLVETTRTDAHAAGKAEGLAEGKANP